MLDSNRMKNCPNSLNVGIIKVRYKMQILKKNPQAIFLLITGLIYELNIRYQIKNSYSCAHETSKTI